MSETKEKSVGMNQIMLIMMETNSTPVQESNGISCQIIQRFGLIRAAECTQPKYIAIGSVIEYSEDVARLQFKFLC